MAKKSKKQRSADIVSLARDTTAEDRTFLVEIASRIARYAKTHDMEPDDTIKRIAEWLLVLIDFSTFNNWHDGGSGDGT